MGNILWISGYSQAFRKSLGEDASNRSSSGLAISNSECCALFGNADANDKTSEELNYILVNFLLDSTMMLMISLLTIIFFVLAL